MGNLGKHEEAFKCFDKAVEIDPNFKEARDARERERKKVRNEIQEKESKSRKKGWHWDWNW